MKPNRSDVYTDGLCNTFTNHEGRSLFFELDNPSGHDIFRTINVYYRYRLDCVAHLTGNGLHFLSPTVISKDAWKEAIDLLKGLNPKCPMTTLRIQANKHKSEAEYFYKPIWTFKVGDNMARNSYQLANKLSDLFGVCFIGQVDALPKVVRYPLPL